MKKYEVYFPKRKKNRLQFIGKILKIPFIMFCFFAVVNLFFISSFSIESISMSPGLDKGERVFTSPIPYGILLPFGTARFGIMQRPERGDVAVVAPPYMKNRNTAARVFEPFVNFFTFQNVSLFDDYSGHRLGLNSIKRIIGLPGDTIKLENFLAYIKPRGSEAFVKENELISKPYRGIVSDGYFPEGWVSGLPFSGNMAEITLGENEYFVLGDNRGESNDSRSWGPVTLSCITSKAVLRYWPFSKIAGL
jgi:signal peptidase I